MGVREQDIILNVPFDESRGTSVAYDYSAKRADIQLHNASFSAGRNGNAVEFTGDGYGEVVKQIFDNLNGDFTIDFYVHSLVDGTGFTWYLNFSGGEDNRLEVPISAGAGRWTNVALVRNGSSFSFYQDGQLVAEETKTDNLLGLVLNQDYYGSEYGVCLVDDLKIYNAALTKEELKEVAGEDKRQAYTLDGVDFREFGVFVSDSDGILNRPKLKTLASISWDNYHGEDVDLNHKYYEAREITLSCFIKASNKMEFINQMARFEQLFDKRGLHRLVIDVHPTKPLIYEVYCKDEISVSKRWSDTLMVGTFKLKLTEPQPVKRVLRHVRVSDATKTCTITLTSSKLVNVFWGDGEVQEDISGKNVTISHTYEEDGEYFPVITGCIDEIEAFTTNAIVVWNKL